MKDFQANLREDQLTMNNAAGSVNSRLGAFHAGKYSLHPQGLFVRLPVRLQT